MMIEILLVKFTYISLLLILILNQTSKTKSDSWEYKLVHDVLDGYDSSIRPSVHHNTTLNVTFGLALAQLIDVGWIDNKLKWDPDMYDGIEFIHIPTERLWKPDILLVNNADVFARTSSISTNAIVKSNGNVTWLSTVIFKSSCSINVRYFPFDEQVCDMIFASWTFDGFFLDINVNSGEGDITNYIKNGEWHLVKLLAIKNLKKYSCCEEPYPEIVYRLVIRRRPLYYLFNMVFPCLLITLVAFLGFYLPPGSTEKVSIGITTLLSITVFLMLVAESMPPTSEQLPLLSIYYAVTIGIVSCSTAMAVLTLNINNKGMRGTRVPKLVKIIFLDYLAKILRTKLLVKKEKTYHVSKLHLNEAQSPLISFKKKPIGNHVKSVNNKESISAESTTKSYAQEKQPNEDQTDENHYLTNTSTIFEDSSKEIKLNNKIDKLILEATDDYLTNNRYQNQLDLIDADDNYIYYVNLASNDNSKNSTNNNENKLIAKAFNNNNNYENPIIIKPSVKLDSVSSYNNSKTPTALRPESTSTNSNMLYLPGTPVCQLHCICECSNNTNSINDNRSNQSFQVNCSNIHKSNNSKSNLLTQNNEDFTTDFLKKSEIRRRSSQVFIASNSSPRKHHNNHLHYHQNGNNKRTCHHNLISGNFIHELEHLLENQFNPLVNTIMNVVANNEKRMLEEEHQESIQNDWSNVAKVADHFLCYFFPIVTITTCLFIFLNSPHAFSQW